MTQSLSDDLKYFLEFNEQLPVALLEVFAKVLLHGVD
jgi:hypothetical protein